MNRRSFLKSAVAAVAVAGTVPVAAKPTTLALGTADKPIVLTDVNIIDLGRILDEQDIPAEGRHLYLPPWLSEKLEYWDKLDEEACKLLGGIASFPRVKWRVVRSSKEELRDFRRALHGASNRQDWGRGSATKDYCRVGSHWATITYSIDSTKETSDVQPRTDRATDNPRDYPGNLWRRQSA